MEEHTLKSSSQPSHRYTVMLVQTYLYLGNHILYFFGPKEPLERLESYNIKEFQSVEMNESSESLFFFAR